MAPRVTVFIDYQNAHLSAHNHWCAPGEQAHKCLIHPAKLAERVVARRAPGGVVDRVLVYRGRPDPRHQPDAARYSDRAAAAWSADERVTVERRALRYPEGWPDSGPAQEKGIDVKLAVDMVRMATAHEYEVGILFSRDTDLVPALELIFERGGAHTEVATWEGKSRLRVPGRPLHCHILDEADFAASRDTRDYEYKAPAWVPPGLRPKTSP